MKKTFLISLLFAGFFNLQAQKSELSVFEPLLGKTWKAEGTWGDGSKFKQETVFKYSLDSTLVLAESKGFTNQEQTAFGSRNHGIRKFDAESNSLTFWEFDVFGGVTTGTITTKGKDIIYTYDYGGSIVTDYWKYIDANTYGFTVGNYENGTWKQTYLQTQFKANTFDFGFQYDHYSIVVTKLMETGDFYRDIIGLTEIPHPDRAPGFRWFQIKGNTQLHLIKKEVADFSRNKSMHLCLATQNLEDFIEHLMANNIDFYDWPGNKSSITDRSDGVKQIYIQDPEGYWIEINTAIH
ncbi:VOC family protein [Muricauda sp. MAR_2010_75]|uniref:VOC family protein n=1 Tax=Allomuricauda sp. MAR_2010_75 TaxID=1250232 RepID=UPI0009E0139C|nr:VOC family protein [Muricauda sp. MAR_2010_75]